MCSLDQVKDVGVDEESGWSRVGSVFKEVSFCWLRGFDVFVTARVERVQRCERESRENEGRGLKVGRWVGVALILGGGACGREDAVAIRLGTTGGMRVNETRTSVW